jgi:hypothetical protein
MNFEELKKSSLSGWNTWYSESVLTHVLLPWGFAINLNFRKISNGDILRLPLIRREPEVRADVRSFGADYTCLHIRHGNVPLKVESAVRDGEQFIVVTPDDFYTSDEQLIVETAFLWGRDGTLTKENGVLGAICPDGTRVRLYSNTSPYEYYLPQWHSPSLFFTLEAPVVISTVPCTTEEACRIMGEHKRALALKAERYGKHAESFSAMQSVLGWNTIYDPLKNRICAPVSRNWNKGKGGMVFCWDTFFAAVMLAEGGEKDSSYLTFSTILEEMFEDGMVPNCSISTSGKNGDHSQPLTGSMCAEKIYEIFKETDFLKEVYPKLMLWNTWFYENRMRNDGTMSWGSRTRGDWKGTLFGAKCESGMDNSPPFDDAVYDAETGLLMQSSVGLTGLFVKDCKALINIAKILGEESDIALLAARKELAEAGIARLWHAEAGCFDCLDLVTGKWVTRRTPMNFFALYSDKVSAGQKRSVADNILLNPEEFWGEYVLPSVNRRDCSFSEQHYWRGRIWAPLNFLAYEALKDAGLIREAKMLAEKSAALLMREWQTEHHVYENYSAVDGLGSSARQADCFYHWGALLGYIALDAQKQE